jgi:hypothetical protein
MVQKIVALQKSHRVGLHLGNIFQLGAGESHKVLSDVEILFARNLHIGILQDAVIGNYRACYGVLDRHNTIVNRTRFDSLGNFPKSGTRNNLNRTVEISLGHYVVETPLIALNRNAQRRTIFFFIYVHLLSAKQNVPTSCVVGTSFFSTL